MLDYAIGATSFHGKDFVYDINQDGVNKDAIIRFLKKVRAKFGKQKITIVLNNAIDSQINILRVV